jgi:hypothetical protein
MFVSTLSTLLVLATISACGGEELVLRGSATGSPSAEPPETTLVLPAPGDTHGETLVDGWPVWIVRHFDGTASVLSAVAPHARSGATLFAADAVLVRWIPRTRRLLAEDVAYDEAGHVLGFASDDACDENCPGIAEPAPDVRDLDTFAFVVDDDRVTVGARVPAPAAVANSTWVEWDHAPHVTRELAVMRGEHEPAAPIAISDALAQPPGRYAVVTGSLVQSTLDEPRICIDAPHCAACDASSPRALGIAPVPVSARAVHAESGTLLVRREPEGLTVIATSIVGACGD